MSGAQEARGSLGSRFQYGIFQTVVRCRLVPLARVLLVAVVLYYVFVPRIRRRCMPYLSRRFPGAGRVRMFVHAFRLYLEFGCLLLDRMVAGTTGKFPVMATEPLLRKRLREAAECPRGCIILSAHIGAWQMGLAGLEQLDRPVHVVQWRQPQDAGRHYFEYGKGRPFAVIDAADPVGGLVEAAAALRRSEIVCLMGDRLAVGERIAQGVDVPFLGGMIRVPVNAFALASLTGAALLMLFSVREKGRTRAFLAERLDVPSGLPRRDPAVFLPYALRFARGMERVVERYPHQFFNFHDMWST